MIKLSVSLDIVSMFWHQWPLVNTEIYCSIWQRNTDTLYLPYKPCILKHLTILGNIVRMIEPSNGHVIHKVKIMYLYYNIEETNKSVYCLRGKAPQAIHRFIWRVNIIIQTVYIKYELKPAQYTELYYTNGSLQQQQFNWYCRHTDIYVWLTKHWLGGLIHKAVQTEINLDYNR